MSYSRKPVSHSWCSGRRHAETLPSAQAAGVKFLRQLPTQSSEAVPKLPHAHHLFLRLQANIIPQSSPLAHLLLFIPPRFLSSDSLFPTPELSVVFLSTPFSPLPDRHSVHRRPSRSPRPSCLRLNRPHVPLPTLHPRVLAANTPGGPHPNLFRHVRPNAPWAF